ncbi:MAG TPA: carotenoid biosynthesis protein [Spirochaetota bacterium]|nr:carotenoid biosynthesis protein [Spirochaetota bacterium]HOD13179.1 carotenoid biosynthesis protein [Spirochaetota bacterium]HPG49014.1 carotenoid biosynthesis protein [Spirochaetota bacterium]HPN12341.1 carotenoid biosynthesis protein [Spirochaetota bacterium]
MKRLKNIFREIWESLPAWFMFYITAWTLYNYIACLPEPRYDYAVTFIPPYAVFLVYYWSRVRSAPEKVSVGAFLAVSGATSIVLAFTIALGSPIRLGSDWPSHADTLITWYEISNIAWTFLLAGHCFAFGGWRRLALFFGVAFLYGMVLESSGVTMGYFSEDHYHLYLPGFSAPVATMFGWSTVFYPCVYILDGIRRGFKQVGALSFAWQGLFVAIIALCFDAVIDPFATAFGLWKWNGAYLPESGMFLFGVPLLNFISWFSAVFSFGIVFYYFELKKPAWSGAKRAAVMLASLPLVLAVAAVLEFGSLAAIEGLNGPSWTILKDYFKAGMPMTREPRRGKMPECPMTPRR